MTGKEIETRGLCPEAAALVEEFNTLDEAAQKAVFAYICAVVDEIRAAPAAPLITPENAHRELERQLDAEKYGHGKVKSMMVYKLQHGIDLW